MWSPDMIWFDGTSCYGSPSYYVQKMYARNMGDAMLETRMDKAAAAQGVYYSVSYVEKTGEILLKIVNSGDERREIDLELPQIWKDRRRIRATILTGTEREAHNSIAEPQKVAPYEEQFADLEGIELPPLSFTVLRIGG